jgi:hypothetical protein
VDPTTIVLGASCLLGLATSCVAVGVSGMGGRLPAVAWAAPAGFAGFVGAFRSASVLVSSTSSLGSVPLDALVPAAGGALASAAQVGTLGLGICGAILAATSWGLALGAMFAPGRFAPGRTMLAVGTAAFAPTVCSALVWALSGPGAAVAFGLSTVAIALGPATATARDRRARPIAPTVAALAVGAAMVGAMALRPDDPLLIGLAASAVLPCATVAALPGLRRSGVGALFTGTAALLALGVLLAPFGVARARRAPLETLVDAGAATALGADVPAAVGVRGEAGGEPVVGHCVVSLVGGSAVAEPLYPAGVAGLPSHPSCPPGSGAVLPLPGSARPVVAAVPGAPALDLLKTAWFTGGGTLSLLVVDAATGARSVVPIDVGAAVGSPGRLWLAERGGETAVFVDDKLAGVLEDPSFATRLRVARTRSGADRVRFVVTEGWTVQELVSRCLSVRGATAPDGSARCEAVPAPTGSP